MRKALHYIYKNLLNLVDHIYRLIGTENVLLEISEVNKEFLDNFDSIGDYKRVFPFQTQLDVNFTQTKRPNLSTDERYRREFYAPPINSFSVSSPEVGLPQIEVLSGKYTMKNSYLEDFNAPDISGKSDTKTVNYIYVKKHNGLVKNWNAENNKWKIVSFREFVEIEKSPAIKSFFNMHNLKNEEYEKTGSIILLEIYMS